MGFLRKVLLALLVAVFGSLLILLVVAVSLNHVAGSPGFIKRGLAQSGIYDRLVDDIMAQGREPADQADETSLPLEREEIRAAARAAFRPALLQSSLETMIDGTYVWLQGKSPAPQFQVDLAPAKADFANRVGSYARERVADLPPCTRLPENTDPFDITCRPPGADFEPEIRRLTDELATTSDYLADPFITPDDLTVSEEGRRVPYYQVASGLPRAFGWLRLAPFGLGLLAAVTALGVVALSRPHRRGMSRLATALVTTGIVTLAGWWLLSAASAQLNRDVAEAPVHTADFVQNSVAATLTTLLEQSLGGIILLFSLLYIGLGLLVLGTVWLLGRRVLSLESPPSPTTPDKDPPPPPEPDEPAKH